MQHPILIYSPVQQDTAAQAALLLAAQIVKDEKLQRIHHTLKEIIALVPTGLSELFPGKKLFILVIYYY